jgi:hypothetical protein
MLYYCDAHPCSSDHLSNFQFSHLFSNSHVHIRFMLVYGCLCWKLSFWHNRVVQFWVRRRCGESWRIASHSLCTCTKLMLICAPSIGWCVQAFSLVQISWLTVTTLLLYIQSEFFFLSLKSQGAAERMDMLPCSLSRYSTISIHFKVKRIESTTHWFNICELDN